MARDGEVGRRLCLFPDPEMIVSAGQRCMSGVRVCSAYGHDMAVAEDDITRKLTCLDSRFVPFFETML